MPIKTNPTKPNPKAKKAPNNTPFQVGKCYLIRTATMAQLGRVTAVYPQFIALSNASWVADTGRFADALRTGALSEVEPGDDCIVGIAQISDGWAWRHPLPRVQK